ncbi:MAG: hypothetical protein U7126_07610 [Microcoleus sp.]
MLQFFYYPYRSPKTSAFSIALTAIASNSSPTAATGSNFPFPRRTSSARKLARKYYACKIGSYSNDLF